MFRFSKGGVGACSTDKGLGTRNAFSFARRGPRSKMLNRLVADVPAVKKGCSSGKRDMNDGGF